MTTGANEYAMLLPAGWRKLSLAGDAAEQIESLVTEFTSGLDRDSAAARKHVLRLQFQQLIDRAAESPSGQEPQTLLFPVPTGDDAAITASIVVSALEVPPTDARVVQVLVALSRNDPTSTPIAVGDSMALRTHEFRDMTAHFQAAVDDAEVTNEERAGIQAAAPERIYAQRVNYVMGRDQPRAWLAITGTALGPVNDPNHELSQAFFTLFDAIVGTFRWTESP